MAPAPTRFDEFSVHKPKETVVFGGVSIAETLEARLEAVPEAEVRSMRRRVLEMAPRVVYWWTGSAGELRGVVKDAVDLAVDGVLRRTRRRTRAQELY